MNDLELWKVIAMFLAPIMSAAATWAFTNVDFPSLRRFREYEGPWHAYYLDPDEPERVGVQHEVWSFTRLGRVTVTRHGKVTFKGRLSLKSNKAYMLLDSCIVAEERLFVMLDKPTLVRGDLRREPLPCLWLGRDERYRITAGHGLLRRDPIEAPQIKNEFLRAEAVKEW